MQTRARTLICLLAVVGFATAAIVIVNSTVLAQSSCLQPPAGNFSFPQGQPVYYSIDPSIDQIPAGSGNSPRTQITNAIATWNTANQGNGSGITFLPADANHPANLTISNDTSPSSSGAGTTPSNNGVMSSASITFHSNAQIPNNGGPGYDPNQAGYDTAYQAVMAHELGHTMGLGDTGQGCTVAPSVMNNTCGTNNSFGSSHPATPTACDQNQVSTMFAPPPPAGDGGGGSGGCGDSGVGDGGVYVIGDGGGCSPIIIDVDSSGYSLTDAANGVAFDLSATGNRQQLSWTTVSSTNAFLVLDRNTNGLIDNGQELFGNFTPLNNGASAANGWLALAEFDRPEQGGNGDGIIDKNDAIYSRLQLWQDINHDGVSQPNELHTLEGLGVDAIHLEYHRERRRDQNGNVFRYRALVEGHDPNSGEPWHRFAYDVFLVPAK